MRSGGAGERVNERPWRTVCVEGYRVSQIVQIDHLVDERKIGWINLNLLVWSFLVSGPP